MSDRIWADRLYTKRFLQSVGGILLCGINPAERGGRGAPAYDARAPKSFFSDSSCPNSSYDFQRKIRRWFDLWGYRLREQTPRKLELSISHANWVSESSAFAEDIYAPEKLVKCAKSEFFPILEAVRPRLLIFFGVQYLPGAFADKQLLDREVELFGPVVDHMNPVWFERTSGKRRFRAMSMRFKKCRVIGLPHPTPRENALGDDDVRKFSSLISAALRESGIVA